SSARAGGADSAAMTIASGRSRPLRTALRRRSATWARASWRARRRRAARALTIEPGAMAPTAAATSVRAIQWVKAEAATAAAVEGVGVDHLAVLAARHLEDLLDDAASEGGVLAQMHHQVDVLCDRLLGRLGRPVAVAMADVVLELGEAAASRIRVQGAERAGV